MNLYENIKNNLGKKQIKRTRLTESQNTIKEADAYGVALSNFSRENIERYFGSGSSTKPDLQDESYLPLHIYNGQYFFANGVNSWDDNFIVADFNKGSFYKIDSLGKGLPLTDGDIEFIYANFSTNNVTEAEDIDNSGVEFQEGKSYIKGVYIPREDKTVIFKYTRTGKNNLREEVTGFYAGTPEESATRQFNGKPYADYDGFDEDHINSYPTYEGMLEESTKLSIKESNPARYLGVKQNLTEKVNHANDEINAKIREALRSKTAARKYADDFKNAGITVDDSPREGVILVGPNGKRLSADRLNISGPTQPGFGGTHDRQSDYYSRKDKAKANIERNKSDIKTRMAQKENLKNMNRDDIIRKYADKSTEDALAAHDKEISHLDNYIASDKADIRGEEGKINRIKRERATKHNAPTYWRDREIDRQAPYVDKIDYKGYLDSNRTDDDKDFEGISLRSQGVYKKTPGQVKRQEFKNLKDRVEDTEYSWNAQRILDNKNIDEEKINQRKKEIEEEYKQRMANEVDRLRDAKASADKAYQEDKEYFTQRNNALNDFRKANNLKPKKAEDFDAYLNRRANK